MFSLNSIGFLLSDVALAGFLVFGVFVHALHARLILDIVVILIQVSLSSCRPNSNSVSLFIFSIDFILVSRVAWVYREQFRSKLVNQEGSHWLTHTNC
jgi:hypothetical protein